MPGSATRKKIKTASLHSVEDGKPPHQQRLNLGGGGTYSVKTACGEILFKKLGAGMGGLRAKAKCRQTATKIRTTSSRERDIGGRASIKEKTQAKPCLQCSFAD